MIEREKVIKGFECCLSLSDNFPDECLKCPYVSDMDSGVTCMRKMGSDALALLKEQEAKPIAYTDNPYTGLPVAHCPKCGRFARQFHSAITEETHYCPWCGQAVEWYRADGVRRGRLEDPQEIS